MERTKLESAVAENSHLRGLFALPLGGLMVLSALGNWAVGPLRHAWVFVACALLLAATCLPLARYYNEHYGRVTPSPPADAGRGAVVICVPLMIGGSLLLSSRASWSLDLPVNPTAISFALVMLVTTHVGRAARAPQDRLRRAARGRLRPGVGARGRERQRRPRCSRGSRWRSPASSTTACSCARSARPTRSTPSASMSPPDERPRPRPAHPRAGPAGDPHRAVVGHRRRLRLPAAHDRADEGQPLQPPDEARGRRARGRSRSASCARSPTRTSRSRPRASRGSRVTGSSSSVSSACRRRRVSRPVDQRRTESEWRNATPARASGVRVLAMIPVFSPRPARAARHAILPALDRRAPPTGQCVRPGLPNVGLRRRRRRQPVQPHGPLQDVPRCDLQDRRRGRDQHARPRLLRHRHDHEADHDRRLQQGLGRQHPCRVGHRHDRQRRRQRQACACATSTSRASDTALHGVRILKARSVDIGQHERSSGPPHNGVTDRAQQRRQGAHPSQHDQRQRRKRRGRVRRRRAGDAQPRRAVQQRLRRRGGPARVRRVRFGLRHERGGREHGREHEPRAARTSPTASSSACGRAARTRSSAWRTTTSSSNGTGLLAAGGAEILSLGDNAVFGNDTDGSPTGTFAPK